MASSEITKAFNPRTTDSGKMQINYGGNGINFKGIIIDIGEIEIGNGKFDVDIVKSDVASSEIDIML